MEVDVAVIGAGPAGSTLALRLAHLGYAVLIVEKSRFPRPHIGESLTPGVLPLLRLLEVEAAVEARGFLRPVASIVAWDDEAPTRREQQGEPGFQVDRARFDGLLLEAAEAAGARVLWGAATRPARSQNGWLIPVRTSEGTLKVRARLLADASGRRGLLGGNKQAFSPATTALYGYWRGAPVSGPETRVEAGRAEWYWGAPLPDGEFNATVFLDTGRLRREAASREALGALYRELIGRSRLLRECLEGRLTGGVHATDATCLADAEPVSPVSIKVGEASFSIDPLSSQGVQTAMQTGYQAAAVIHTVLAAPEYTAAALAFYRHRQQRSALAHARLAASHYAEMGRVRGEPFWTARATAPGAPRPPRPASPAPERVQWSSGTRLVAAPALCGDLIRPVPAIDHPGLEEPVAFLGGVPADRIYRAVAEGELAGTAGGRRGSELIAWLWDRGLVEPREAYRETSAR